MRDNIVIVDSTQLFTIDPIVKITYYLYYPANVKKPAMPKVSTKRQITIPIDLCQQAHIEPGDDIETFIHEGQITIVKKQKNAAKGILDHIKSNKKITDDQSLNESLASRR
jgi:bifunctional DNA-binding transcriptional regulator/antitoxin component of YhaV-PrlF toxin-antitoxin module